MAIYRDGKHDNGIIAKPKRKYTKRKGVGIHKPFEITSVCKADILGLERYNDKKGDVEPVFKKSDILKLTSSDMKKIASKLADDYCDQLFWSSLEIITESVLESKKKENDSRRIFK